MTLVAVDLTTTPIVAAIIAAAVAAMVAIWVMPKRQVRRWERAGVQGRDLADLENSARATLVQIVGGVALILTFAATWMQIADARKATNRTLELTESQQETERFTRAVDGLGSERFALRLGGIFSLDQVGRDSARTRAPIVHLMAAYLKQHAPRDDKDPRLGFFLYPATCRTLQPTEDTQAALATILRFRTSRLDLSRINVFGVRASGADFRGVNLTGSQLAGADLRGAHFNGARLYGADLRGACLNGAVFGNAGLGNANLRYADLSGASLGHVKFFFRRDIDRAIIDPCTRLPWRRQVPARCGSSPE
jgi:Pentapeptide repeats (8 copies)